ncbi:hypothetical protein DEU56DRAFT_519517 [Suillus clintonianus]|uniref:uncharacterized protein n=1 Tax=Suillus clintonianus TaxID=1904413 RepID=UPI001B88563B|nr:uncharacterized protein DEU56DRAFT_519517 [Suillus clintonianus]KAG2152861.1 hypothetical protein DEU56DRAFT_519517 [Suillus clintonianus]
MLRRSVIQAGHAWYRSLNVPLRYSTSRAIVETDAYGIPLKPTWSVQELLSSYPAPTISPATFKRLHELSALSPPEEGTPEYAKLKHELEELIKLVEATKLIKVEESGNIGIPDGRVIAEGSGTPLDRTPREDEDVRGQELLSYASRSANGMYVVETDRSR